ncbi:uncharacterized protein LACBIDRAFT_328103 [Laccaria bicolor S238N-H82]|uniref:Predicted protein n=1 Tax=Laccaria bicolor (strain S238N-H82 / ATCC MYA-4686) TaxID=486041 RepID=B0DDS5_LACBS|nr:uncharacterized protein LACBIDRAFT_328103 [Laccaria bicolor S238N-H82]EDR07261.1 predicted protein [Laccaria bicolor S238N-H82]|eukprot:XP_001882192.1 predicted protein [Laccaria bicolor S238N-H82]
MGRAADSSSAPKRRKVKNIVENSLEISNIVLTTLNNAASMAPVPYLQQAAGLALGILNIVQGAKDNRDAFHKLAADTCELVYVVLCMYEEATKKGDDRGPSRKLVDDLQGLLGTISSIERFLRKEVSRGALFRLVRSKADLGKIQEYRDTLRRSLDLFGLQSNVAIREATSQLINQHEKILLELQRDREKKNSEAAGVSVPAPAAVDQENVPVAPAAPIPPIRKDESPKPSVTVTHIGGDKVDSHSLSNVTNTNSGNVTITTTTDSNNDNSYRQYGGRPGRGPVRRGPRK